MKIGDSQTDLATGLAAIKAKISDEQAANAAKIEELVMLNNELAAKLHSDSDLNAKVEGLEGQVNTLIAAKAVTDAETCVVSTTDSHECRCPSNQIAQPLLIGEDADAGKVSVKLGDKFFTDAEIAKLMALHGDSRLTTWEIFETLDSMTMNCEHHYVETDAYTG